MAYGSIIQAKPNSQYSQTIFARNSSIDNEGNLMIKSASKHLRTLTTSNTNHLLDSDCFISKEAITMSKKTKKAKKNPGVYKRRNTWSYTVYPIDSNTGLKKQKWVCGFESEKSAVEAQAHAKAEILSNSYIPESSLSFEKYLTNWFGTYKKTLQPSTIQGYWNNLKLHVFPAIGSVKLSNLDRTIVTNFCFDLQSKGLAPKTIKYIFSTMRKALNEAVYDKIISVNPCIGAKRPKEEKYDALILNEHELLILRNGIKGTSIETEILLALFGGLRRGEVLGLRFKDCDLAKNEIHVSQQVTTIKENYGNGTIFGIKQLKTKGSKRTIVIPGFVMKSILSRKAYIDSQKSLAGSGYMDNDLPNGSCKSPQSLLKQFKRQLTLLNLPNMRFHDLRHTCASLLIENDIDLKTVSNLLGHSTISTTADIYVDLLNKKRQPADKMQAIFGEGF